MTAEPATVGRQKKGKVVSVQGPVVDVKFLDVNDMPDLHETISTRTFDRREIMLLVAEHIEGNIARCVSLASTLNLQRNAVATASGETLKIPVGEELFGRIVNVMGQPIDGKGPIQTKEMWPIHRDTSKVNININKMAGGKADIVETGIKAVDLLFPVMRGSKTGIIGGAGCGKTVLISELQRDSHGDHPG